jgi:hypothetical protein
MTAIAFLHNFTINKGLINRNEFIELEDKTGSNHEYVPSEILTKDGEPIGINVNGYASKIIPGVTIIRETLTARIKSLGLKRPKANVIVKNQVYIIYSFY